MKGTAIAGKFGVVVLAAGGSARLGRPKQLLPYLGRTLVEHAVRTALASGASEVVVVVGANADAIRVRLAGLPVRIVNNREWAEGMGSSIRRGVAALGPDVSSAVIALADQPRITPDHLRSLAGALGEGTALAASSYDGVVGAPCAFARSEFPSLLGLTGDAGARFLIRQAGDALATIAFDGANVDVDTSEDFKALVPDWDAVPVEEVSHDPHEARGPPMG